MRIVKPNTQFLWARGKLRKPIPSHAGINGWSGVNDLASEGDYRNIDGTPVSIFTWNTVLPAAEPDNIGCELFLTVFFK